MAFFAKIGLNNKVIEVLKVNDSELLDSAGNPDEEIGRQFLEHLTMYPHWIQTFSDKSKRKHFAGPGHSYDEDKDAFIPRKPFASWTLNASTCIWEAPTAADDPHTQVWNEDSQAWE